MMKRIHAHFGTMLALSVMLLLSIFALPVRAERAQWGYCGGLIADGTQGAAVARSGSNAWVDCCIRIPADKMVPFSGNRVTAVRVGLMDTAPQVDSIVVWVRSAKEEANLVEARMYGVQEGWNEVAFASGYDIDGSTDLYIGFSYYQKKKLTAISLAGTATEDGAWTCVNSKWDNGNYTKGSISIEAVIEGDHLPHRTVQLISAAASLSRYRLGDDISVAGSVHNPALDTLRTLVVAYTFDDRTDVAYDTVQMEVPFLKDGSFKASIPTTGLTAGVHTVHITPEVPNADRAVSGSADFDVTLVENLYVRNVVLEEFTSEYCGNCPGGITRIRTAIEASDMSDNVIWLCHHAAYGYDWLSNEYNQAYEWFFVPLGYTYAPAMMFDRTHIDGFSDVASDGTRCVVGSVESAAFIRQTFEAQIADMATVGVSLTARVSDGAIRIDVSGERSEAFASECASPHLYVMLKENNIAAHSQSGVSGDFVHQHVVRTVATDTWGDPITWNGDSFTATYTVTPDASWDVAQMEAVAFVSNYSATDRTGHQIYNAAQCAVSTSGSSALESVHAANRVVEQSYTSLSGADMTEGAGLCLRRTRYADGTVRVEKVFVK